MQYASHSEFLFFSSNISYLLRQSSVFRSCFLLEKMSHENILESRYQLTARHRFHFPEAPVGLIRMILMILILLVLLM